MINLRRVLPICGISGVAICATLLVSKFAIAKPGDGSPQSGSMSEVAARMATPAVKERLAKIFSDEGQTAAFCKDPVRALREMGVPIVRGATVSASLVATDGNEGGEPELTPDGSSPIPIIYGVVCQRIGNITVCWYSFNPRDRGWDNLPELTHGFEGPKIRDQLMGDLKNVKSGMSILKDPRGYLANQGIKVPGGMSVSASLQSGVVSGGPNWPSCMKFQIGSSNCKMEYSICLDGSAGSKETEAGSPPCCSIK